MGERWRLFSRSTMRLDRNPAAIVLLDESGTPVHANRAAEALRKGGDGIRLAKDGIRLARKPDDDRLQSLIARARSRIASADEGPGGVMRRCPRSACARCSD